MDKVIKNTVIELNIIAYSADGYGIGKIDSFPIFVPLTAVGDTARVLIIKVAKSYAIGKLIEVIKPSKNRQESLCTTFSRCGGCAYQHITYEEEKQAKWQRVADAVKRIGGLSIKPLNIIGADTIQNYRNKATFPVGTDKNGKIVSGFFAPRSHNIISSESCNIQNNNANLIQKLTVNFMNLYNVLPYDEITGKGLVRHIYVRCGEEIGITLIINGKTLPHKEEYINYITSNVENVVSIVLCINQKNTNKILNDEYITIFGKDFITDTLCGLKFNISPAAFYQVNKAQCEKLYNTAIELAGITKEDKCLDLYCGIGTITLLLAKSAGSVIGVEIVPQAIENAKINAKLNDIGNVKFICGDATSAAIKLKNENIDVMTVDPPRAGLDNGLIDTIIEIAPKRIVYISCDPSTLARDLKLLDNKGYNAETIIPVDMFPRTSHVETVVLMSRAKE